MQANVPCIILPIIYGFIDKLFFAAILNICRKIENPAKPNKKADIIIWFDIYFVCKDDIAFSPLVSSNKPVIIEFPYSDGIFMHCKILLIEFIIFKLFNIDMMMENSTINPPIKSMVDMAFVILLLNIVPKSEMLYEVLFVL